MGPQPFGCGRSHAWSSPCTSILRFNGAATFRLRKGPRKSAAGSRRLRFNGAATFRLRKEARRRRRPCRKSSFNGAATFRLRKAALAARGHAPRPLLQWGRNLSVAEGRSRSGCNPAPLRFNGAATFRLRKGTVSISATSRPSLQWGRNLSVAEGLLRFAPRRRALDASMGPQPFGCGRESTIDRMAGRIVASMGPQPFGCGRPLPRDPPQWTHRASMGPQPFGCGRVLDGLPMRMLPLLQWGRNLSVAEGCPIPARQGGP